MRKTTLLLSIMLAVAFTATAADAKKHKKMMKTAAAAPAASKINGYAWPGSPYSPTLSVSSKTCYGCN